MDINQEIELLIKSRCPVIYIVSWEERRVEQTLKTVAVSRQRKLHSWSIFEGFKPPIPGKKTDPDEDSKIPLELRALADIKSSVEGHIFLLKDFHQYLKDYRVIRLLRDLALSLRGSTNTIIVCGPTLVLPIELEKDIHVLDFPLPNRTELEAKLNDVIEAVKADVRVNTELDPEHREVLIKSAQGLTLDEFETCLSRSITEFRSFSIDTIIEEKKQIIQKTGMLEYYPASTQLKDVGGYLLLKSWLNKRKTSFTDKARQYGIPAPKGVLILGVQGCGKSLVAKSIASEWDLPLLKLDMGRIFGSLVGQSEENIRKAIRIAEGVSPCVLWLDELEKAFGGLNSSGDSGTSQRVFATFLSWMQEKTKPVFLVATANDVSKLPPELLRKGRFDEIFFIDLPTEIERQEIFGIHIEKRKRKLENFDISALAAKTDGFSGAEIEQVVIGALYTAFDQDREITTEDMLNEANTQVPLSRMMAEDVEALREWAKLRARPSS